MYPKVVVGKLWAF